MDFLNIVFNILSSGLPCCLLALGIFLTYRLLDFADLTAEGSFLLGAAICGVLIYNGANPFLATLASIGVGAIAGIITGVLNRYLKIPKLLSGIITLTMAASIALIIMGTAKGNDSFFKAQISFNTFKDSPSQTIYSLFTPYKFNEDYGIWQVVSPWGEVVKIGIMAAVVVIAMLAIYFFFGTEYGMAIRATGMSEKMARAQGINTDVATIVCVSLSNAVIALAGALYVQEAKSVSTITATGYLVIGLASILVGEAIFGKRSFKNWLISVALGSIIYFVIVTIAIRLGLPTELKSLLYAILITIALCIPFMKIGIKKMSERIKAKKRGGEATC
jgi:putative ABC transport system permease protein